MIQYLLNRGGKGDNQFAIARQVDIDFHHIRARASRGFDRGNRVLRRHAPRAAMTDVQDAIRASMISGAALQEFDPTARHRVDPEILA